MKPIFLNHRLQADKLFSHNQSFPWITSSSVDFNHWLSSANSDPLDMLYYTEKQQQQQWGKTENVFYFCNCWMPLLIWGPVDTFKISGVQQHMGKVSVWYAKCDSESKACVCVIICQSNTLYDGILLSISIYYHLSFFVPQQMTQNMFQEGLYHVFFKETPSTHTLAQGTSQGELNNARIHRWFGTMVNTRLLVSGVRCCILVHAHNLKSLL